MSKKSLLVEAEARTGAGSCNWRGGAGRAAIAGWPGAHASVHHAFPRSSDRGGHPGSAPSTMPCAQPCTLPISSTTPATPGGQVYHHPHFTDSKTETQEC